MSRLTLSRCASLVAIFAVLGTLLAAGPAWGRPSAAATATLEPIVLLGFVALALAALGGGWALVRPPWPALPRPGSADLHRPRPDGSGSAWFLREQREEAEATAEAVRIFGDGLLSLSVQPVEPTSDNTAETIAELAAQASVMALRATLAAAQAGGGFAASAARAKDLSEQSTAVSEAGAAAARRAASAPDQDLGGIDGIADPIRAIRAASASLASKAERQVVPGAEPSSGRTNRLRRTVRAA
jgi:hypothetical protein